MRPPSRPNDTLAAVTDEQLRTAAQQIASEFGLDLVVLFGSAATGDRRYADDLDIAVRGESALDVLALTNRLMDLLHVNEIDVSNLGHADSLLLALVARDGILLYAAAPHAFTNFRSLAYRRFADAKKFRDAEHAYIERFIKESTEQR